MTEVFKHVQSPLLVSSIRRSHVEVAQTCKSLTAPQIVQRPFDDSGQFVIAGMCGLFRHGCSLVLRRCASTGLRGHADTINPFGSGHDRQSDNGLGRSVFQSSEKRSPRDALRPQSLSAGNGAHLSCSPDQLGGVTEAPLDGPPRDTLLKERRDASVAGYRIDAKTAFDDWWEVGARAKSAK
jgi:hypothetical protein